MDLNTVVIQTKGFDVEDGERALQYILQMLDIAADESFKGSMPNLVVLPECVWPGYLLGYPHDPRQSIANLTSVVQAICAKAKAHGCYIIAGLPEQAEGRIYNSAYLIDDQGEVIATVRKSLLWHFDREWFCQGQEYPVFDLPIGRIGIVVCADGRQPEIIRILALQGAQLIVDTTNWVCSGKSSFKLSNPQYEYMLPSRAVENQVWCVAANKVGIEASSIVFCGKSCIVSPSGAEVAAANSYEEDIISAVITLTGGDDRRFDPDFDVIVDRRPGLYRDLCLATADLPLRQVLNEALRPDQYSFLLGVGQVSQSLSYRQFLEELKHISNLAAKQRVELLVLPGLPCLYDQSNSREDTLTVIRQTASRTGMAIVAAIQQNEQDCYYKCAVFADRDGTCFVYRKTHLTTREQLRFQPGDRLPVFATRFGNIGLMMSYEGLVPEISRTYMLNGADLICWLSGFPNNYNELFARTRAAENKLFVAVANSWQHDGGGESLVCNPFGQIVAQAFRSKNQLIVAQVDLLMSRCKTVISGTNVYEDRLPQAYGKLLEEV